MVRKTISIDGPGGEWLANIAILTSSGHGDNAEQIERLKRNLAKARKIAITPRQEEVLTLYYDQGLTMGQIALKLGVNRSTVCRTLHRARVNLYKVLQFSF